MDIRSESDAPGMGGGFVTFDGIDGSGKSTQLAMMADWLVARGYRVCRTREPGGTPLGVGIRGLVMHGDEPVDPRAEALLYAADRAHHVATVVRPALACGEIVLQDRYIDASIAYQAAGRELAPEDIAGLSRWATRDLTPDLTVIFDLPVSVAMQRRHAERATVDRIEAETLAFHERVRAGFLAVAEAEPTRVRVIAADDTLTAVHAAVCGTVEQWLARRDITGTR